MTRDLATMMRIDLLLTEEDGRIDWEENLLEHLIFGFSKVLEVCNAPDNHTTLICCVGTYQNEAGGSIQSLQDCRDQDEEHCERLAEGFGGSQNLETLCNTRSGHIRSAQPG